jgi:hypothetical protein
MANPRRTLSKSLYLGLESYQGKAKMHPRYLILFAWLMGHRTSPEKLGQTLKNAISVFHCADTAIEGIEEYEQKAARHAAELALCFVFPDAPVEAAFDIATAQQRIDESVQDFLQASLAAISAYEVHLSRSPSHSDREQQA